MQALLGRRYGECLELVADALPRIADPQLAVHLRLVKGNALLGTGRNREAREVYFQVYSTCRMARFDGDYKALGHKALMNAGLATRRLGEARTALQFYREVLTRAGFHSDAEEARMRNLLGSLHLSLGEHSDARVCFQKALQLLGPTGEAGDRADVHINLAILANAVKDPAEVTEHLEQARALCGDDPERRLKVEFNMGTLLLEQGNRTQAWVFFDKAQDLARRHDLQAHLPQILCSLALIRHQEGAGSEAGLLASRALEAAETLEQDNSWVRDTCQEILQEADPGSDDSFSLAETLIRTHGMVAVSEPMRRIIREIEALASSGLPVMIIGETGTGKELVARALHTAGPRSVAPFVPVNCPAIPEGLFESTLFGHVKGAFTGATESRKGMVELAMDGSIFLDEIGDLPLSIQPKLLRFLETGEFQPMGSTETRYSSARIISATNRDPGQLVESGQFRKDLLMRISAFRIDLPPLSERREDVYFIAASELDRLNRRNGRKLVFSARALQVLNEYDFPGNVRELKNAVARGAQVAQREVGPDDMGLVQAGPKKGDVAGGEDHWPDVLPLAPGTSLEDTVRELETRMIQRALSVRDGDREQAARDLGLSFRALKYKISKYGIQSRKKRRRGDSADDDESQGIEG